MSGITLMNVAPDFRRPLRDENDFYDGTSHSVAGYLPVSLRDWGAALLEECEVSG
jgi:hypothetical protein